MAYKALPSQTLPSSLSSWPSGPPPSLLIFSHPFLLSVLGPAKRLATSGFCTAALPVSKAPPELDSSLVQKLGNFSHFHRLLQNSQGVSIILFTFTTEMWVQSSASFSRRGER